VRIPGARYEVEGESVVYTLVVENPGTGTREQRSGEGIRDRGAERGEQREGSREGSTERGSQRGKHRGMWEQRGSKRGAPRKERRITPNVTPQVSGIYEPVSGEY
jgi:hypothetical protein